MKTIDVEIDMRGYKRRFSVHQFESLAEALKEKSEKQLLADLNYLWEIRQKAAHRASLARLEAK